MNRDVSQRVGHNVNRIRKSRGLTLAQLSELTSLAGKKILRSGLSKIEIGLRRVWVEDLDVLTKALDVTAAELLEDYDWYGTTYANAVAADKAARA